MTPDDESPAVSSEAVYETMEPLEPYTTGELATALDAPKDLVRRLLDALSGEGKVRKKEAEPKRPIWIRTPPAHTCKNCGWRFEITFLHPAMSQARYCPRCGTRLK